MDKKKVLILGAGNSQIDAIEYCKAHDLFVAGCSYTNTDKGIPMLDDFRQADIKDVDAVAKYASDLNAAAVYSVGSDLAVPTVMRVSEMLGLPHFISYESAMLCHSKDLMRGALGHGFEGNVDFMVCETIDEALTYDAFPAMMKPVDSQGQRGCFKVSSKEDIAEHFNSSLGYSVGGKVIIESYIDGPEISVNAYRYNGETVFAVASDRESFAEYPGGLPKKHRIPSTFADESTQVTAIKIVDKAADALGISDGPCYCQMKIGRDGRPYIIEITPRLDGCHMWDLIKHWCGVDLLDACFRHLTDGDPGIKKDTKGNSGIWELEFFSEKTGESFDPSKYEYADAEKHVFYYEAGDTVSKVNGYFEKCGCMIRRIQTHN